MRARVWSETPPRPLSTLETVEMETSASAATSARVARVAGSPDVISADMRSSLLLRGPDDLALKWRLDCVQRPVRRLAATLFHELSEVILCLRHAAQHHADHAHRGRLEYRPRRSPCHRLP